MPGNNIIAVPLRIEHGTAAAVRARLLQLESSLKSPTTHFSPGDQAVFWRDLGVWCSQNLSAIDAGEGAAGSGALDGRQGGATSTG
jgi:hypothetical protein